MGSGWQAAYNGGKTDGFVAKLNQDRLWFNQSEAILEQEIMIRLSLLKLIELIMSLYWDNLREEISQSSILALLIQEVVNL